MKDTLKKPEVSPKIRQILIETDGREIWIRKAETSKIELIAICQMVIAHQTKQEAEQKPTE